MLFAVLPAALGFKLFQQTSERFGDLSVQFLSLNLQTAMLLRAGARVKSYGSRVLTIVQQYLRAESYRCAASEIMERRFEK